MFLEVISFLFSDFYFSAQSAVRYDSASPDRVTGYFLISFVFLLTPKHIDSIKTLVSFSYQNGIEKLRQTRGKMKFLLKTTLRLELLKEKLHLQLTKLHNLF